jgi:lipid-A-disaccharide synthase
MKYYIIAGERSGDLHASNLMKSLLKEDPDAQFRYFGGDYMKAVAKTLVVHIKELAFMGLWSVIKNLGTINRLLKLCKNDINTFKPDAIILVDYAGFNLKIAKYAKSNGYKVYYYISPKVWAWNQKRALKIKSRVDHMFSILPFELDFYKKYNWQEVTYVGNPVVEAVKGHQVNTNFLSDYGISTGTKIIAVLPGSRKQELVHMLPPIREVILNNPELHYYIAAVNSLPAKLYDTVATLENVTLLFDDTYNLLAHASAAIITSGTATLETALWNVPQVVLYRADWVSYKIGMAVIKVKYISLVNLIMEEAVIKELIQGDCTSENISMEVKRLLKEGIDYSGLRQKLGENVASEVTAKSIILSLSHNKGNCKSGLILNLLV